MSEVVSKLKSFMGFITAPFAEEEEEGLFEDLYNAEGIDYPIQDNVALKPEISRNTNLKVVNHPKKRGDHEVMVVEPRSFEDALDIVNHLKDKRSVTLNLHFLDNEQSQRFIDFLSGAALALEGNQQKIGEGVFIFTPQNVCISAEEEKVRAIKDAFWSQSN